MPEIKPDGTIGRDVSVSKKVVISQPLRVFIDKGVDVTSDNLDQFLLHRHSINSVANRELAKKLESQKLSPEMSYCEGEAKAMVQSVRRLCGLPEVLEDEMRCVYYNDEEFRANIESFGLGSLAHYDMQNAAATSSYELIAEVVRTYDCPNYYIGSIVAHELVHRYVDYRTRVFRKEPRQDFPNQEIIRYELVRAGLMISSADRSRTEGQLLNELGDYYVNAEYLRDRLNDNNPLVKEEIERRNRLYSERFGESEFNLIQFSSKDGKTWKLVVNQDKVHFDSKGEVLFPVSMMAMQLADDINELCGEIDGGNAMELLLQAKSDPKLTGRVKEIFDEKIGPGFFGKVRKAVLDKDRTDIFDLLKEVQDKIYTIGSRESN